jgi:hypothetical protein
LEARADIDPFLDILNRRGFERELGPCPMPARHAAFDGPGTRLGISVDGATETDLNPLTSSNRLTHFSIRASKRSLISNSFFKPSNVAASPISTNSNVSPSSFRTRSCATRIFSSANCASNGRRFPRQDRQKRPSSQLNAELTDDKCNGIERLVIPSLKSDLAHSFVRSARLDSDVFERLGRYEIRLWRQVLQTILLLNSINRGAKEYADCDEKYFNLRNCSAKRRRALWPPFTTSD